MSKGILQSALQNPGLHLELEYRSGSAAANPEIHSSWRLAELDQTSLPAWFEFCRTILDAEAIEAC